jgi:hypothetical protein
VALDPDPLRAPAQVEPSLEQLVAQCAQGAGRHRLVDEQEVSHGVFACLRPHLVDHVFGRARTDTGGEGQDVAAEGAFAPVASAAGGDGQDGLGREIVAQREIPELGEGQLREVRGYGRTTRPRFAVVVTGGEARDGAPHGAVAQASATLPTAYEVSQ